MLSREGNSLQLSYLLKVANVSRSGYYEWKSNEKKRRKREKQDQADFELILSVYNYRGYNKGARTVYMLLLQKGKNMNLKKIRRLMKKYDLRCPIRRPNPYRQAIQKSYENKIYSNTLNRKFKSYGPRMVLLTDITYLYYKNGQICYLSVVKDAFTGECLGHVVSPNLKLDFVIETFNNVIRDYGETIRPNAMVHSDQGIHYTSVRFSQLMSSMGFLRSMSERANCWDNAPQESFFGHMKDEINDKIKECETYNNVKAVIDDWVDYYNNERPQWDLAKLSPNDYYKYCITGEYPFDLKETKE